MENEDIFSSIPIEDENQMKLMRLHFSLVLLQIYKDFSTNKIIHN